MAISIYTQPANRKLGEMPMVSNDELKKTSNQMRDLKMKLFDKGENVLECTEALKVAEEEIYLKYADDPKGLGGNEPTRKATIAVMTACQKDALKVAESEKRKAQLAFDLASMRYDCLKWQIRNEQASADCEAQGLGAI